MIHLLLATSLVIGKVEIAPQVYQYDILTDDQQVTKVICEKNFCESN